MYSNTPTGKNPKGSVGVEVFQGRLRLRLPRQLYSGKQKYLSLNLSNTPENQKFAQGKARQIELDILANNFDETLSRYKPQGAKAELKIASEQSLTLIDLFTQYIEFKTPTKQANTIRLYKTALKKLIDFGKQVKNWNDAQSLIQNLRSSGISDLTIHKYCIDYNACVNWGIEHGMWHTPNPFKDFTKSLNKHKSGEDRLSFTLEQRDAIIQAFKSSPYYSYYASFVEFRFLSGCRTGEVTGLQWKHIDNNFSTINFCESVVLVDNEWIRKPTKTDESRIFKCNRQLQVLLSSIKPENCNPDDLVFPSREGGYISPKNFTNKAWIKTLTSIGLTQENELYAPPYCTRHTFITLCLAKGIPPKDIAGWCGTSVEMIYKHYVKNNLSLEVPEF